MRGDAVFNGDVIFVGLDGIGFVGHIVLTSAVNVEIFTEDFLEPFYKFEPFFMSRFSLFI